jgi:DNA-directed RNA polymerase I, II, and III subunit RPABC2
MSDNEYYSNSDSENSDKEDSDNEETVISSSKKPLFKPSISIKQIDDDKDYDIDDSEPDDADEEDDDIDEDDDVQVGGVDDFPDDNEDYIKNDDEEDSDIELNEDGEPVEKDVASKVSSKNSKPKKPQMIIEDEDDEEDDEYDENYLQKFDNEIIKNYVNEFHPECLNHNYAEITKLSVIVRNPDGIIVDPLHRTIPYLTKYERARVLGQRAKQIETGAKPLVKVPENVVDSYIIAELELREKKVPFIIRRPIPGGGCEYWNLKDLEQIAF